MNAAIVSIGDELVLGQTVDTNSAWLSEQLAKMGVKVGMHLTVEDEIGAIVEAIDAMCERSCLVLVSGGLGPTDDDLTRQGLAKLMNADLVVDEKQKQKIKGFFEKRLGRKMPERNVVQAMRPAGTVMIDNHWGTAPGIKAEIDGTVVVLMPGVPKEMREMFKASVAPMVREMEIGSEMHILTTKINTFGMGESNVAETLGELMNRDRNPVVGTTVSQGICSIRIRAEYDEEEIAKQELDKTAQQVEEVMGKLVFGRNEMTLQETVVGLLRERGQKLATAESCTGGLIGKMITDVAGSSDVYEGGVVSYSYELKEGMLGISHELLEKKGAVCEEVAHAMAGGIVRKTGAEWGIGITGIAGPDGGTEDKPVGTVWFAVAKNEGNGVRSWAGLLKLTGDRERIRDRASKCVLQALRLKMMDEPIDSLMWLVRTSELWQEN